jgi:hypothetical protein
MMRPRGGRPHRDASGLFEPKKTAMRVRLGVMRIQAGSAEISGAEAAGFPHNNGAGVIRVRTAAVS